MRNFWRHVVNTVDFAPILSRKGLRIVLDVAIVKDIHFGVSVNYMLVPQNTMLSTVHSVGIFHATYS
jgi:hypothetical protein